MTTPDIAFSGQTVVAVEALAVADGKVLLVRGTRPTDGRSFWWLPGGMWAPASLGRCDLSQDDPIIWIGNHLTPQVLVQPYNARLLGVDSTPAWGPVLVYRVSIVGTPQPGFQVQEVGFFDIAGLPDELGPDPEHDRWLRGALRLVLGGGTARGSCPQSGPR